MWELRGLMSDRCATWLWKASDRLISPRQPTAFACLETWLSKVYRLNCKKNNIL